MNDLALTKMLCACANWGNGGWLEVDVNEGQDSSFSVGPFDSAAKTKASVWSIKAIDEN